MGTDKAMSFVPRISIVMPSLQQRDFIEEAVRSVLDQEDVAVELLVMDPGSTDGSRELLLSLQETYGERLRLYFELDDGQADAINKGMSLAQGRVLAWLNSDDRLRSGTLRRIVETLDVDEPRWLYGRCGMINERGEQISRPIVWYKNVRGRRFSMFKLLTEDFIPQMATFWNRALWDQAGGLDKDRHLAMDYDLFLRFARLAQPVVKTEYLADFRIHGAAKSSLKIDDHLQEARQTAAHYAFDLGWHGRLSYLLHRVYAERTRLIYKLIKP